MCRGSIGVLINMLDCPKVQSLGCIPLYTGLQVLSISWTELLIRVRWPVSGMGQTLTLLKHQYPHVLKAKYRESWHESSFIHVSTFLAKRQTLNPKV